MSNPNYPTQSQNDARYSKPADVAAAISTQAATDAGQYLSKSKAPLLYEQNATGALSIAANLPTGSITSLSETGQAVQSFGNTPLQVSAGGISHTPINGQANSAGYLQAQLTGTVRRAGIQATASSTANAAIVIVLPAAAWSAGNLGVAGVHLVVYPSGSWHVSQWTGSAENIYASGTIGSWNDGIARTLQVAIDVEQSSIGIKFPDGSYTLVKNTLIAPNISNNIVWEIYYTNGSTEVPPVINQIWADDQITDPKRSRIGIVDVARALSSKQRQIVQIAPEQS